MDYFPLPLGKPGIVVQTLSFIRISLLLCVRMFLSRWSGSVFECVDTRSESFQEATVSRLLAGRTQDIGGHGFPKLAGKFFLRSDTIRISLNPTSVSLMLACENPDLLDRNFLPL